MEKYNAVKKLRQENRIKDANDNAIQHPKSLKASNRMCESKIKEPVHERLSKKAEPKVE